MSPDTDRAETRSVARNAHIRFDARLSEAGSRGMCPLEPADSWTARNVLRSDAAIPAPEAAVPSIRSERRGPSTERTAKALLATNAGFDVSVWRSAPRMPGAGAFAGA